MAKETDEVLLYYCYGTNGGKFDNRNRQEAKKERVEIEDDCKIRCGIMARVTQRAQGTVAGTADGHQVQLDKLFVPVSDNQTVMMAIHLQHQGRLY